jgi:triosephosphate isomerase
MSNIQCQMSNMKKLWIIANFKSNLSMQQSIEWIEAVGPQIEQNENIVVGVCPRFSVLSEVAKRVKAGNYPLLVGSQNISPFGEGAYTGEESVSLINEMISFSIIGHSERRTHFAETDEIVAEKTKRAKESEITPLVCVQNAETPVPTGCEKVAYEPVFAIGTGTPDTPENAEKVAKQLQDMHGEIQILYGGSVNRSNCASFVAQEHIGGLLIGKASMDPQEFVAIVKECLLVVQ